MANMLTVTVGLTDYTFDWVTQEIHVEAAVTEVMASDLKTAIHDAQDDPVGLPFPPIAQFFNPVTLTGTSSTFLNVVLQDQWRIDSLSSSGTFTVGDGNVVNVNNGIDIFASNALVNMVNNVSAAGVLVNGAISDQVVEGTRTVQEALRLILAATSGKVSGAGTTTVTIRDTDDTKDRIVATVDELGNRSVVVLDDT